MKNVTKHNRGYIALMATIIISVTLLVMAVKQGSSGWSARFNILGTEAKEQASNLAEGCAEQAFATMLTNPSFNGDVDIDNEIGTCHVMPLEFDTPVAGLVTIKTQAVVRESYANLQMVMNMYDIHLNSIPSAPTTGTIFITTHVINDSTGSKQASDFIMKVNSSASIPNFPGSELGEPVQVPPGSAYSVSEVSFDPSKYAKTATSDCTSATIAAGEVKFCTITYDDVTTTLTLVANVVNDNGGTVLPKDILLSLDGSPVTIGQINTVSPGPHTVSAVTPTGYAFSAWGYDCAGASTINITAGQNKTCIINYDDPAPPAPSCADTVMILDRTGSMSSTDRTNEGAAATSLVNLYAGVLPPATLPQLGVGSIGAYPNQSLPAGAAGVPVSGQLSTGYNGLKTLINQMMGGTSSVGSDLSAGLTAASNELNSSRHIASPTPPEIEKEKVIILVSDGDPNEPSGSTNFDTGFKVPTVNAQNTTGELWSNASNAYSDGAGDASDPVSENDRHQFSSFGFGSGTGLPSGSTVRGIEVSADAWTTAGGSFATSSNLSPTSLGNYEEFTPSSGTDVSAVNSNNGDTSYIDNSVAVETFVVSNAGIPAGSTINSVTISAIAKGNPGSATMQIVAEKGGTLSVGPNLTVTSGSYNTYTRVMTTDPTGAAWTLAEVNAWTSRFGVRTTAGANSPRVTQVFVTVNYSTGTDSGLKTPTATHSPNNWDANTVANAQTSNGSYISDNDNDQQGYSFGGSGLGIPGTATITGIEVVAEAKSSDSSGCEIGAELSSNGSSFTNSNYSDSLGGSDATTNMGGSGSMWGRSWTPSDFNTTNFTVRIEGIDPGFSCSSNSTTSVDLLQVRVYYTNGTNTSSPLSPTSLGNYEEFTPSSGTDVSAVNSNNGDTSYIDNSVAVETFVVSNAGIPAGSTINSVTISAIAKGNPGSATMQIVAEKGGTLSVGPNLTVTSGSYNTYTRVMTTDPTGAAWTLAEVNAWTSRFGVRTTAGANSPRVTQVFVTVSYNAPGATACQLGMDLSWNGGSSWTSEKTQNINGTETSYTLGSSNDDWSSSHAWTPTEFSNANFRARVRAIDSGSGCDNTAVEHLDLLEIKVHYTQNVDPTVAALNSADTAKTAGIDIFTIHFGSDPSGYTGRELLANLASGGSPVAGHQNGSVAEAGGVTSTNTGLVSPTSATTPNQFTNPTRAFSSDNSYATDTVNGHQQGYTTFNFNIPPTATINGVNIEVEAKSSDSSGCQIDAELSSNNGTSFTSAGSATGISGSDNTYNFGGSSSLWSRTWTPGDFSNGKFVVRLQNVDPGNNCTNGSTLSVDRIRARVYYTVNTENDDGDNFFIAPTSADMQDIFDFIGNQVCPAALNLAATPPPTTATIIVMTTVTNNNGGGNFPPDFKVSVSATNPSQTAFDGNSSGVTVTVNPGSYNISQSDVPQGYAGIVGASCSGNIIAGESRVCVLTNDDVPPPPPPPNLNFDTDSWHEIPTATN